jgi:hypothetical protein
LQDFRDFASSNKRTANFDVALVDQPDSLAETTGDGKVPDCATKVLCLVADTSRYE